jgi:hypothetical protein
MSHPDSNPPAVIDLTEPRLERLEELRLAASR